MLHARYSPFDAAGAAPGRWIVRVALNGSRDGDEFSAYYDLVVEVTD